MAFNENQVEEFTLEDLCLEGVQCSDDIGPAEIKLTPLCNADVDPYIIDCSQQLNGSTLTLMQAYQPRQTQCSSEPEGYVPSGRSGMFEISLAEGNVDARLLEIVENAQWVQSPYAEDGDSPILAAMDNAGTCPILFMAEFCPSNGSRDLIFPVAQLYTEEVSVTYNNTDQREMNIKIFARTDKRTNVRYYWRPKAGVEINLEGGSLLSLPPALAGNP